MNWFSRRISGCHRLKTNLEAFCTLDLPRTQQNRSQIPQLNLSPVKSLVPIGGWVDPPMVPDSYRQIPLKVFRTPPPKVVPSSAKCKFAPQHQGMVSISNAEASVAKLRAHGCEVQFSNYQGGVLIENPAVGLMITLITPDDPHPKKSI